MKIDDEVWNESAAELEAKALEWWEKSKAAGVPGAVKWLSNDETGALVIVTRGEYAEELKRFIMSFGR